MLSRGTLSFIRFDLLRTRARIKRFVSRGVHPPVDLLHFGCGATRVPGWLNVDLVGSDYDVDIIAGRLPWADGSFSAAVSQHVIEHLEMCRELLPLLKELRRIIRPGGEIWLSCPDLEKVCRGYVEDRARMLVADRETRSRKHWERPWSLDDEVGLDSVPTSHMVNSIFYQRYEHRNLFDFELLAWLIELAGFIEPTRASEAALLERFAGFPVRGDDLQSLYVRARTPPD
jgi:predicted SAM-dependent methyltransferase